ncbi:hypothetical protein RPMA_15350 [Tardiphaga alba]|uniref:Uncharacterized protein n=1 Tax=Tardiphaga alba TaxID=340268 RepID=A0ABX8ACK1_9BRAD|nr:hypothetical protein [Tardiphaga alba]QUS40050.1 hypothetical protein RPMA_15350 [Tardiphaga alba]
MILRHQMSKARRAKVLEFDIKLYSMVAEELAKVPEDRRSSPIIVSEINGRSWKQPAFRQQWREAAKTAKIPSLIRNMDSRAGEASEMIDIKDDNLEKHTSRPVTRAS